MATQKPREPQGQAGNTVDRGEGVFEVDPVSPQEGATSDSDAQVAGFTPEGDRPTVADVQVASEGGEPGFADKARAEAEAATAYDNEAAEFAAFQRWRAEQRAGSEAERTNASARAFTVDEHQQGPSNEQVTLLAANPEAFRVTREQGVAVHIPAEPPKLTEKQVEAGDQPASNYSALVVVPNGAPLPQGTTHEQLQYLLLLGWARPAGAL